MSRITNIITRVRDTLADPTGDRWSDERLLRLVDEAQKDICRKAKLLRTKVTLEIFENQSTYKLPNDLLLLDRVLFNGKVLPLVSHSTLDDTKGAWEDASGLTTNCIFDKQNRGIIKLYPRPTTDFSYYKFVPFSYTEDINYIVNSDFGVISDSYELDVFDNNFGVVSDIKSFYAILKTPSPTATISVVETVIDSDLGILTNDNSASLDTDFGIVTNETNTYLNSDFGIVTNETITYLNISYDVNATSECILEEISNMSDSDYGIVSALDLKEKAVVNKDGYEGITTNIDKYTISGDYGILTTIDDANTYSDDFGVVSDIIVSNIGLIIYYIKKPNTIVSINDTIEIDDIFDSAIKYYVTGKALRDDMDTQNRTVGNEELNFYNSELQEALKDDFIDFTRNNNKQFEATYNGGF